MRKIVLIIFNCFVVTFGFAQNTKEVFGIVSDDFGPLENVYVSVLGNDTRTLSGADGKYSLIVKEGDILGFTIMGKIPLEIRIEDVTRVLNVTMFEKVEKLDEVTVSKKIPRTQEQRAKEYNTNPNIIKNTFGYLDKETVGYSLRILDEKDIGSQHVTIATLLDGRFAGVRAKCSNVVGGELVVSLRNGNTTINGDNSVVFEVDGILIDQLDCGSIDPSNIKKIGIISSLAGTSIYGTRGRGGVVVINTKTGTPPPSTGDSAKSENERNTQNLYLGDALPIADSQVLPTYLKQYREVATEPEAMEIYENELPRYAGSYHFILDSYTYFKENRQNRRFAESIITDNWTVFENNPVALKSLAYLYQENEDFAKAKEIYKEVFLQRPEYPQSYYNLAESYVENGEFAKAATLLTRFDYLLDEGYLRDDMGDFTGLMHRELENLIALKGKDFLSAKNHKKLVVDENTKGTRLVFEWADSEAEFELQYVNPQNRFFKFNHTLKDNGNRIMDGKSLGYSMEEYVLGNSFSGDWKINIKYLGNKSLTPTYLKATIYHDYGYATQRKETKVFKLSTKNINQELFTVNNSLKLVSN